MYWKKKSCYAEAIQYIIHFLALVLHGLADGFVVWLIRGEVKLHAGVEVLKCDRGLLLVLFRCEKDCSHAYVEPNLVNTAILTRCTVTGSAFQVLIISWTAG